MGTVIGNHSTPRSLAPSPRDRAVLGNAHPRMPWQNSLPALKPAHQRQAVVSSKAWQHSCLGCGSFVHSHGAQSYPCSCSAARGSSAVPALPSLSPVFPRDPCLAGILAQQANDLCHRALTTKPGSWGWSNSDVLLLARTVHFCRTRTSLYTFVTTVTVSYLIAVSSKMLLFLPVIFTFCASSSPLQPTPGERR